MEAGAKDTNSVSLLRSSTLTGLTLVRYDNSVQLLSSPIKAEKYLVVKLKPLDAD